MKKLIVFAMSAALAGCLTAPRMLPMATPFDATAFEWAKKAGSNTISGDAVLRTRGGDVKTCAGLQVELFPATTYTEEYVQRRFGSADGGYADQYSILGGILDLAPGFYEFNTSKVCDAQGRFTFDGLADGSYYVVATVTWEVPGASLSLQGGDIAERVEVSGGKTVTVTLTA